MIGATGMTENIGTTLGKRKTLLEKNDMNSMGKSLSSKASLSGFGFVTMKYGQELKKFSLVL